MHALLFVHGINVRDLDYVKTLEVIELAVGQHLPGYQVVGCPWGNTHGARLRGDGASIPNYDRAKAAGVALEEIEDLAAWSILFSDPLFELRLQGASETHRTSDRSPPPPPAQAAVATRFTAKLDDLRTGDFLARTLNQHDIQTEVVRAVMIVQGAPELRAILRAARQDLQISRGVARAIAAQLTVELAATGRPTMDGNQRDQLVLKIEEHLADGVPKEPWVGC